MVRGDKANKVCDNSVTVPRNLKKHIHTVRESHREYKCEPCDKSFSQAGNLKKHLYTIHNSLKE